MPQPMIARVTISPFRRPILSIYAPNTTAPIGRIKNAGAKNGKSKH
uniref:Uncharacterized protein n=1 Tax=Escherichia coli TaxID=562 RepID=I3VZV6_ECOLX|nr:hypothetical protein [Escherichia coli]